MTRRRQSTRLPGHNHSGPGAFFVTICAHQRRTIFGMVSGDVVHLTSVGQLAEATWKAIPSHFPNAKPIALIVMPNHVHGVILMKPEEAAPSIRPQSGIQPQGLQVVIRNYKAAVTFAARQRGHVGRVWQRGYYDRILRSERELWRACEYIASNPSRWSLDKENPVHGTG